MNPTELLICVIHLSDIACQHTNKLVPRTPQAKLLAVIQQRQIPMGYLRYKSDNSDNKLNDYKWIQCVFIVLNELQLFYRDKFLTFFSPLSTAGGVKAEINSYGVWLFANIQHTLMFHTQAMQGGYMHKITYCHRETEE